MNPFWAALVFLFLFHVFVIIARRGEAPRRREAFLLSLLFVPPLFVGVLVTLSVYFGRNTPVETSQAIVLGGVVTLFYVGLGAMLLLLRWQSSKLLVLLSLLFTLGLVSLVLPLPSFLTPPYLVAGGFILLGSLVIPHGIQRVWRWNVKGKGSGLFLSSLLLGPSLILAPVSAGVALARHSIDPFREEFLAEITPDNASLPYIITMPVAPINETEAGWDLRSILLRNARVRSGDGHVAATPNGRLQARGTGPIVIVSSAEYNGRPPNEAIHGAAWAANPVDVEAGEPIQLAVHWMLMNPLDGPRGCQFRGAEARFVLGAHGEVVAPGTALDYVCID